jgi:thiol-disulfide isomerase/thioredoxin
MRQVILTLILLWLTTPLWASADSFVVTDSSDNELTVEVLAADGELLAIWLVDHAEERQLFDGMLQSLQRAGIEVWRVDLLGDYFLPRSSENVRTMSGDGVATLLRAAHQRSDKQIVVAAYDRMPLPLLRGVRQWQLDHDSSSSRLAGAMLFYPNLFGPPPLAGEDAELDPIVAATNIPVTIYQPENGAHRLRLGEVMQGFWGSGSAAYSYLVAGVRDWFFMHPLEHEESDAQPATVAEKEATARVPQNMKLFTQMMASHPMPTAPAPLLGREAVAKQVTGLFELKNTVRAPEFELTEYAGGKFSMDDYRGKVTLVNFWATWCPPCVEEVPSLNQLALLYREQGLELISIDFRESREQVAAFTHKVAVDYPILLDGDGKVSLAWEVFGLPSSFIVDRQGQIRYSVNRAIDWDTDEVKAAVEKLLGEPE